jgi:hypothetical protein
VFFCRLGVFVAVREKNLVNVQKRANACNQGLRVKRSVKRVKKVKSTGCEGLIPFLACSARLVFDLYIVHLFGRGASGASAVVQHGKDSPSPIR